MAREIIGNYGSNPSIEIMTVFTHHHSFHQHSLLSTELPYPICWSPWDMPTSTVSPGTGVGPADMVSHLGTQENMRSHSSLPWQHALWEEEAREEWVKRESKKDGEGERGRGRKRGQQDKSILCFTMGADIHFIIGNLVPCHI